MGTFIPRYMDALPQILWWELDELVILFLSFFLGLITRQLTTLLIVGVISTFILAKLKNGKSDGFIFHLAYWYGIPSFAIKGVPSGAIREFVE